MTRSGPVPPASAIAVVLFTRDLRVHDQPALATAAAAAQQLVPLFVVDPRLPRFPNRRRFLTESLNDLRESLRRRGSDLLVRRGDPADEAVRLAREVGAGGIYASADCSRYAAARGRRLATAGERERLSINLLPGVTVVPPGTLRPAGGGEHYRVFTPYWRNWQEHRWRDEARTPRRLPLPDRVTGDDPATVMESVGPTSPGLPTGGESAGRRRLTSWLRRADEYADRHDDLAGDRTSRLSAYLHFGCLSPRAVATAAGQSPALIRQLCWRDFYHQVLAAFPDLPRHAYRRGADEQWRDDPTELAEWQDGHTGIPVVDAGMRQLAVEGFLHNRARLITAGYLTKQAGLDWRSGAAWYDRLLVDADLANNYGNWQWVAGTGNDTRPYRRFNPIRQAHRFDPTGAYVRRWVPELAAIDGPAVHEPWRLPPHRRRQLDYPPPVAERTRSR